MISTGKAIGWLLLVNICIAAWAFQYGPWHAIAASILMLLAVSAYCVGYIWMSDITQISRQRGFRNLGMLLMQALISALTLGMLGPLVP